MLLYANKFLNSIKNQYSTKDREHLDRSNEVIGLEVKFDADTVITLGKDKFLSNRVNKSKFIKFSRGTLDSC